MGEREGMKERFRQGVKVRPFLPFFKASTRRLSSSSASPGGGGGGLAIRGSGGGNSHP